MNSYQENLNDAVRTSLGALYAQQQKLASQKRSAQYSLYYAQGAQLAAVDNLEKTSEQLAAVDLIRQQGVKNNNLMNNLAASSELIQTNTAATVSNSATAAANVQTASMAVAKLAADIGSALNVTAAACYGTDIYKKTLEANSFIRETANQAEYTSQKAMEASSNSSEIIAKELASSSVEAKTALKALSAAVLTEFKTLSSSSVTEQEALSAAVEKEKGAEGTLLDAQFAEQAVDKAVGTSNSALNLSLKAEPENDISIKVSFEPFSQAFTQLSELGTLQLGKKVDSLPSSNPRYFVFLVSADKQSSVRLDQVESIFAEHQAARFVMASENKKSERLWEASFLQTGNIVDFSGKPLTPGQAYVAYVYIVLDLNYQKYIGSFHNLLSCPSGPAMMQIPLPVARNIRLQNKNPREISFSLNKNQVDYDLEDFDCRCMLLPAHQPLTGGFMTDSQSTPNDSSLKFYFNKSIAMQVSSANYQLAQLTSAKQEGREPVYQMSASIPDDMTDNFGNPLDPGAEYIPVVLVTSEDSQYESSLSSLEINPITVIPVETYSFPDVQPANSDTTNTIVKAKKTGESKKPQGTGKKETGNNETKSTEKGE